MASVVNVIQGTIRRMVNVNVLMKIVRLMIKKVAFVHPAIQVIQ